MVAALSSKLVSKNWSKIMEHYLEDEASFLQELFGIFINKNANIMSWLATADHRCVFNSPNLDYYKGNHTLELLTRRIECIIEFLIEIYKEFTENGEYPKHLAYLREEKLPKDERRRIIEALEDHRIKRLVTNNLETEIKNMKKKIEAFRRILKQISGK